MKFIMTVGIPGSGKTTAIKKLYPDAQIVSPDLFIGYSKEDPWTQEKARNAWILSDKKLHELFQENENDILFDATNVSRKYRKKYIKLAIDFGFDPVALVFDTPFDICIKRNASRNEYRKVPEEAMNRMNSRLSFPSVEEGFTKIIIINTTDEYMEAT